MRKQMVYTVVTTECDYNQKSTTSVVRGVYYNATDALRAKEMLRAETLAEFKDEVVIHESIMSVEFGIKNDTDETYWYEIRVHKTEIK